MNTRVHQILGTSMGTRKGPPCVNLFVGKEKHTIIILAYFHLIYLWKGFIDDILFVFLGSYSQPKSFMPFMNTINPTIKFTLTYSEKTVSFLGAQVYLSESRKLKAKLYKKPTDSMTQLHFHSHHLLSCKKGIIYSQALRYNMIIFEDHILQEELNNLTCILLACAYQLHLIIKNIKIALIYIRSNLVSQGTLHTETNILPIIIPFLDIGKSFIANALTLMVLNLEFQFTFIIEACLNLIIYFFVMYANI